MDIDYWGILFRWMHILAAITAVGGTIFMRFALLPSVGDLSEEARNKLHEAVRNHWSKAVMASIGFLLLSGVFNIISASHRYELGKVGYYHPLFGIKFLLALGVFFIASALSGRSKATQKIRDNRRLWLNINLVLAVLIVCISGVLRMANKPEKPLQLTSSALNLPSPPEYLCDPDRLELSLSGACTNPSDM